MIEKNLSILLALLLILTGCIVFSGCQEASEEQSDGVKVGILFPLTGELADKGKDSSSGAVLAIEEINSGGGIESLGGAPLIPIIGDTKSNPETGAHETMRLIEDEGVVSIIGAYQSSVTKMATQVAERLETPFIVSISIADIITERGFRYTFRVQPKAEYYGRDQAEFLVDLGNQTGNPIQKVSLIHENTDFGTAAALAQKRALRNRGIEVVAEISYQADGVTDLSREVAEALAPEPDAILEVTYLNDSILICRELNRTGSHIPLIDTAGGTVSPEYIQILGPMAENSLSSSEYSKFAAGGEELNARFKARFDADITGDSAYAYQSVWVLKDALERAGTTDKEKIRTALAATDMPGGPHMILPAERIRFDSQGQNEFARLFIVQIQDGELKPVWPGEYATGAVRFPPGHDLKRDKPGRLDS